MRLVTIKSVWFPLAALAVVPASASAYGTRSYASTSSYDSPALAAVPVSGSIAMPGLGTAVYTNPAGLARANDVRLSLQGGSDHPMDDPSYRALLSGGNGTFGAAGGVKYRMRDGGDDVGYAVYGLAMNVESLGFSLGVSGASGIKNADGSDFNAGLVFRPTSMVTIGGTAMGLKDRPESYGVGLGLELVSGVDLVADSAFDRDFKNGEFKPGLRLANEFAGLSLSYGTGATEQFAKDFSAAAYLRISANSDLEFEYNHGGDLPKYFASLSLRF